MQAITRFLTLATLASSLVATPAALAQQERQGPPNRGNFDPEQMRARMAERYREQLEITSDDEWKVIESRINKVVEARRNAGSGRGGPMAFGGQRPGRGGDDAQSRGDGQNANPQRGNRGFGPSSPEAEELQKALEAKASPDEIKAKLAKYREARKARQAALAKAQDELRQVLSVRQEASAVLMGILD